VNNNSIVKLMRIRHGPRGLNGEKNERIDSILRKDGMNVLAWKEKMSERE
jgi:hypothetical protein